MEHPYRSRFFVFLCIALLILFYGCTAEEEKQFEQDLEKEMVKQAQHNAENAINDTIGSTVKGVKDALGLGNGNNQTSGECRFDSDCTAICESSVYWKRGCDAQTNKCIKTFDTDCAANPTLISSYSFAKLCTTGGCIEDTDSIHAKKEELVAKANDYTAAMQQTTSLRQVAAKNCISALADVTDNLIISTALTFSIPGKAADLYTEVARNMIEVIGNAGSSKMSAEEYISLNCNAIKVLDTEYALLSKKRDIVIKDAETFAGR